MKPNSTPAKSATLERADVGKIIGDLRQRLHMSAEALADKLGVCVEAIIRWEHDQALAAPSSIVQQRMKRLIRELGTQGQDLLATYFPDYRE